MNASAESKPDFTRRIRPSPPFGTAADRGTEEKHWDVTNIQEFLGGGLLCLWPKKELTLEREVPWEQDGPQLLFYLFVLFPFCLVYILFFKFVFLG